MIDTSALDIYLHLDAATLGFADGHEFKDWPSAVGSILLKSEDRPASEGKSGVSGPDPGYAGAKYLAQGFNNLPAVQVRNAFQPRDASYMPLRWPTPVPATEQSMVKVYQAPGAGKSWFGLGDCRDYDDVNGGWQNMVYAEIYNYGDDVTPDWRIGMDASGVWMDLPADASTILGTHVVVVRRGPTGMDVWSDGVKVFEHLANLSLASPLDVDIWFAGDNYVTSIAGATVDDPVTYDFSSCEVVAEAAYASRLWTDAEVQSVTQDLATEYGVTYLGGGGGGGPTLVEAAWRHDGIATADLAAAGTPIGTPTGLKQRLMRRRNGR